MNTFSVFMAEFLFATMIGHTLSSEVIICQVDGRVLPQTVARNDYEGALRLDICTHIIFEVFDIDDNLFKKRARRSIVDRKTIEETWQHTYSSSHDMQRDWSEEYDLCADPDGVHQLKTKHPHLKTVLAIGGWNVSSATFSEMAANLDTRKEFIENVLLIVEKCKADGIDLRWEYPNLRGDQPQDKDNFITLIMELNSAFRLDGYILMVTVGGTKHIVDSAYDLKMLNLYADYIKVMTYNYHGPWNGVIGPSAPLKGLNNMDNDNLEYMVKYLLSNVNASKVIISLHTQGTTFILRNKTAKTIEFGVTPVKLVGFKGRTGELGRIAYNQIVELFNEPSWTQYWDAASSTPYLRNALGHGDRVISYDNARSITLKSKLAVDYGIAGISLTDLNTDASSHDGRSEMEPYMDINEWYFGILKNPLLSQTLDQLRVENKLQNNTYLVFNGDLLELRLPEPKISLLETARDAMKLSKEIKTVSEALEQVSKENKACKCSLNILYVLSIVFVLVNL